jgi:hypothetical protein
MSETFDNFDDHSGPDEHGHVPEHDDPGFSHDEPPAHEPAVHDDLLPEDHSAPMPAQDAPALPPDDPGTSAEIWHADPAADDDLRAWLDDPHPVLDPPPGFEQRLAEQLAADAARHGASADELVQDVLSRLKGS